MVSKLYPTVAEAIAGIEDGASILIGGFGPGTPWNLIRALCQQGAGELTLIFNSVNLARRQQEVSLAPLIDAGRIRKVIAAFTATTHPSERNPIEELHEAGKLEAELTPQGTLAERIRAGGAGIPAFFTPAGVGTEIAWGKEHRTFNGREYLLEEAITADYAFIRAWKADTFGNLVYRRTQRNFNPLMATAAQTTIAEIEEPIVGEGQLDPDHIHTSGIFVRRLIQIPPPPEGVFHIRRDVTAPSAAGPSGRS